MAKLSARGSNVTLRMVKEATIEHSDLIDWERVTIVLRSDHHLLQKRDVRFLADTFNPSGRKHSYGWKDKGKLGVTVTSDDVRKHYLSLGYKLAEKE